MSLIQGIDITLGTVSYTLPPCGFDTLERHADGIEKHFFKAKVTDSLSTEKLKLITDVVHGALMLNYPDMKREEVARGINMANAAQLVQAALVQSFPPAPAALKQSDNKGALTLGESTGVA